MLFVNFKKCLSVGCLIAGLERAVSSASADSVILDTGSAATAPWQVSRQVSDSPDATAAVNSTAYSGVASVISSPVYPAWVGPGTNNIASDARWISWTSAAGNNYSGDPNGTYYVFTDTFTLGTSFTGPGVFNLNATLASDNWVPSQTPSGNTALDPDGMPGIMLTYTSGNQTRNLTSDLTVVGNQSIEGGYSYSFGASLPTTAFTSPTTFTLRVEVVNSYAVGSPQYLANYDAGPTGLILSGTASAFPNSTNGTLVPLPATADVGFAMLGFFGVVAMVRSRIRRSIRMSHQE
jgi:hypothetical protein